LIKALKHHLFDFLKLDAINLDDTINLYDSHQRLNVIAVGVEPHQCPSNILLGLVKELVFLLALEHLIDH
jgi:hypothetical protein